VVTKPSEFSVSAHFSSEVPGAELFWKDISWGILPEAGVESPIGSNTFAGHEWNVRVDGRVVITWKIQSGAAHQDFIYRAEDREFSDENETFGHDGEEM
jgi:hypothetical protein